MTRTCRPLSLLAALLGAAVALALLAGTAAASVHQESTFQDDKLLVYGTPAQQASTLSTLRALGVDRVRVSVFWNLVAPDPQGTTRPAFDASDPGAYPSGSFDRYDTLLELAQARGIAVNFDITSPAPYWATAPSPRADIRKNFNPSPAELGRFVTALGRRYSGSYVPARDAPDVPAGRPLPRVSYWSVWNEPNQPGWLNPQWSGSRMSAPVIYRSLLDAAFSALVGTGHAPALLGGQDTVLIGETAPKGDNAHGLTRAIKPVAFIEALFCVGSNLRPLRGAQATAEGCPATPDARAFVLAHPGLFAASGYAHHPYELTFAPTQPPPDPGFLTIANLPRLTSMLARIMSAYGLRRPLGLPLYLTEFGYLTNPPSPLGVSFAQQAAYMNESEFITYNNPNVATLCQFLLVDDSPKAGVTNPVAAFGGTFQTGLELLDGAHKPSFDAYRLGFVVPDPHLARGHTARVWGMVRSAPRDGAGESVAVQFHSRSRRGAWRTLRTVGLAPGSRYLDTRVRPPASGTLRLLWSAPGSAGPPVASRSVAVAVGR